MADVETDIDKKRKRSVKTSVSDLDTSLHKEIVKTNKKKKKKTSGKMTDKADQSDSEMGEGDLSLAEQLHEINQKLSNSITRDDDSLKQLIKDTFKQMKDEFLHSVSHRIDILEGKLFEKEIENDKLKKKIELLEKENENAKQESVNKITQIENENQLLAESVNGLEQYGRRNSVRIFGIAETKNETCEQTAKIAAEIINQHIPDITIRRTDVDIAHRLPQKRPGKGPRPIIMKFVTRMTRDIVFRGRKNLKGTNVFINEDLTPVNQHILACVRKKQPDEIESAWSNNGRIYYKHQDRSIHEVEYKDYRHWSELDWPKKNAGSGNIVDVSKKNK